MQCIYISKEEDVYSFPLNSEEPSNIFDIFKPEPWEDAELFDNIVAQLLGYKEKERVRDYKSYYSMTQQISDIFAIYKTSQREEIEKYLFKNADLVSFIHSAFNMIKKYFGCDAIPYISYIPEIYNEINERISIRVNPNLKDLNIIEKLTRFEEYWLYQNIDRKEDRIGFNL